MGGGSGIGDITAALRDVSGYVVREVRVALLMEAVQHPCILATLLLYVAGSWLFIKKIHYGMVTRQHAALAESPRTTPAGVQKFLE